MADGFFWDGYLHWARDIEAKEPEFSNLDDGVAPLYEPIFIRLKLPFEQNLFENLLSFFSDQYPTLLPEERRNAIEDLDEGVRFLGRYVFDVVEPIIGLQHALLEQKPPEFFVYRPVAKTPSEHVNDSLFFEVLDVGAPARVNINSGVFIPQFPAFLERPKAFGAVIDNDIGFLNQSFRDPRQPDETRFEAIWLQARERLVNDPSGFTRLHIGQVLDSQKIKELISIFGRDERGAYKKLNESLHSRVAFKRPPPIQAHGSMVGALAFGNEQIGESLVPLLAVQLPPEAATDTSGTNSESYIVQGVRWVCFWARTLDLAVPLVINISYGVLAGQKDGGKFLEQQIDKEISMAAKYRDGSGNTQQVNVVLAYGNGRNEGQVANVTVDPENSDYLTWLIPADNPFPAFVEFRALTDDGKITDLPATVRVALSGPNSSSIEVMGSAGSTEIFAEPTVTDNGGTVVARLYSVPLRTFSDRKAQPGYTLAAIAPTRRLGSNLPTAKAGDWKIKIENIGEEPVEVVLQIQRGDTAPGFRGGGRQTRFEGRTVPIIEGGVTSETVEPPQSNAGTNSAFANGELIHTAGASRDVFGSHLRTVYTGEGANWTSELEPDALKSVDKAFTLGQRTSGAYSGSFSRLSGTSAAAALLSLDLVTV